MAGSFNRLTLVGNLTRDPEIRYVDGGGKCVTKFALAVNRKTRDAQETMYVDVVAWERLGEICNQYLKKGMSVLVEGRLAIRDYVNKDGEKRRAVECVASDMQMLDRRDDGAAPRASAAPGGGSSSGGGYRSTDGGGYGGGADDFDEEILF